MPFRLNPFHHRILDAMTIDVPIERDALVEASGLRMSEALHPLAHLVEHGYITFTPETADSGKVRRMYTRLKEPVAEQHITIVREDDGPRENE